MINLERCDTNITTACQNKCLGCNHLIPLQAPWYADVGTVERDVNNAAKVMHFRTYTIVGGEPTLHPQAVEFLNVIRKSGVTDRVLITTNGQNADRWPDALFRAADHIIVTPYKLTDGEKVAIAERCREFGVSLEWHWVGFRYMGFKNEDEERAQRFWDGCWYKSNRYTIDEGYFYRCCMARWFPQYILGLPRETDAIALEGLGEEQLSAFMGGPRIRSCLICASNAGSDMGWQEQPDKTRWLQESLQD